MKTARSVSGRLLQLHDEERRRLARDLHDTTGQNIAALQMNLSLLSELVPRLESRSRQALADSLALAQVCVREIRSLSQALYPPLLDEAGIAVALRVFAEDYSKRTGQKVGLELPDSLDRWPQEIEIALFRIVQQALASSKKGSARSLRVRLNRGRDSAVLELTGVTAIAGMTEIRERARLLGGRIELTATKLRVILPVPRRKGRSPARSLTVAVR